tara:strand:- start:11155 stop:12426 length:1272 start_codon:yes stop_codon:yes gene_type:complete
MLLPNETYYPPIRAIARIDATVSPDDMTVIVDGTVVDNATPSSDMYVDSTADITAAFSNDNDTTAPIDNGSGGVAHLFFKAGDLIRIENEILEVVSVVDTDGDGEFTPAHLSVKRAVYGSTAADHADNNAIRLPFFNAYHDFDKYSVAQTDSDGKFKAMNFFGLGRTASAVQGITAGSVSLKFYEAGYQSLGLSGITGSTHSGLAASTEYKFNITVDGGSVFEDLAFTTDSSNLNFGGSNGIISKIQTALDTQFYKAGNLFEKKVNVAIVDGDVRFTSGSHLSTSAILLADPSSGTTPFSVGRIPDIGTSAGDVPAAVAAKLPDDVSYDRVTYATIPNSSAFVYDDGKGNLFGAADGTINYETGAIDFRNAPPNAEFVISCMHTGAFSGKLNESETDRINSLIAIHANTPNQKGSGQVTVKTY